MFTKSSIENATQYAIKEIASRGVIKDAFNNSIFEGVFSFTRPVVKTRNLAFNTFATQKITNDGITITVDTDTNKVPYAESAYFGLEEHRRYGQRRYTDRIAQIAVNKLNNGYNFSKQTFGQYNYTSNVYNNSL